MGCPEVDSTFLIPVDHTDRFRGDQDHGNLGVPPSESLGAGRPARGLPEFSKQNHIDRFRGEIEIAPRKPRGGSEGNQTGVRGTDEQILGFRTEAII